MSRTTAATRTYASENWMRWDRRGFIGDLWAFMLAPGLHVSNLLVAFRLTH
jgi:hypothetical protein